MAQTRKNYLVYLEKIRWQGTPKCPYCKSTNSTAIEKESRYHCNTCFNSYSVTVGTLFHKTYVDLPKWFLAISLVFNSRDNLSARQLAKKIGVNKNTAYSMIARIRKAMTEEPELLKKITQPEELDWEPPMPPTDLIFDDGEPLETNRHRIAMNTLIRSLQQAWRDRTDYFCSGNMFVYYSSQQAMNRDFRGPDFFAVLDIDGSYPRQGWVVWQEGGRYPDIIVELMSSSTANVDTGVKKDLYERVFRTRDYFVFDPFDPNSLAGWRLDANLRYQPIVPNEQGWLWSQTLGFWLGTWEGTIDREPAVWLRFYDEAGNLVPLPEEAAEQQGLEQGLQQGLEQGLQQGLEQGARSQLLRLLTLRFGTVSEDVETRLQTLNLNQLEELMEVALRVDAIAQFANHLP